MLVIEKITILNPTVLFKNGTVLLRRFLFVAQWKFNILSLYFLVSSVFLFLILCVFFPINLITIGVLKPLTIASQLCNTMEVVGLKPTLERQSVVKVLMYFQLKTLSAPHVPDIKCSHDGEL